MILLRLGSVLELNAPSEMNAPSIMKVVGRFWRIVKACYKKQFGGLTMFVSCVLIGSTYSGNPRGCPDVKIFWVSLRNKGIIKLESQLM